MPVPPASRAALATALLVTATELALLFAALSPRRFVVSFDATPVTVERLEFIVTAPPAERESAIRGTPASPATAPVGTVVATPVVSPPAPYDSTSVIVSVPRSLPSRRTTGAPGEPATANGESAIGPVLAPRGFNPSSPLTRRVIDSVLDSLNAKMPALIWARVPTQAERDAAYKESALAVRLSGRALLVPADPHLAAGIQLPSFFSRQRRRETARARTDSVLAENMERLARLRARAERDSLRRGSLQRADSLRSATPRRPPGARTPA